jgi:hypothetical protein
MFMALVIAIFTLAAAIFAKIVQELYLDWKNGED